MYVQTINSFSFDSLARRTNKSIIGKLVYMMVKEVKMFVQAFFYDTNHSRNILYFCLSLLTSQSFIIYAILLIDIIFKIKSLYQVLSIFKENKLALGSTLLLFFVVFYIFAFIGFDDFRVDFNEIDEGACDTLSKCLVYTVQYGLRSGGGVADELAKRQYD